jgi:hypothetical protein
MIWRAAALVFSVREAKEPLRDLDAIDRRADGVAKPESANLWSVIFKAQI